MYDGQTYWILKNMQCCLIDFIYYIPATGWEVEDAVIVGPKSSIIRSQRVEEDSQDTFSTPADIWPTDHKGVLIKFSF